MVQTPAASCGSGELEPGGEGVIVTEVRVHGVGGASPAQILNRTDIVPEVGADRIAGFYGATQEEGRRRVRAYSWGGLTSRKASRALWTLLLPFSFINIAGWMLEPPLTKEQNDEKCEREKKKRDNDDLTVLDKAEIGISAGIRSIAQKVHASSRGLLTAQRWLVHVLAVIVTATYVMWVALLSVDLIGYQCGARPRCYEGRPWLRFLEAFEGEVGRRILVTVAVPIALLWLFLWLSRRSRERYDLWRTDDGEKEAEIYGSDPPPLTAHEFWRQSEFISNLARVHFGVAMAALAGCVSYAMWRFSQTFAMTTTEVAGLWLMIAAIHAAAVGILAIALMLRDPDPAKIRTTERNIGVTTRVTFWGSIGLMAVTLMFVSSLRIEDARIVASNAAAADLWGFGWLTYGLLGSGVALLMVLTGMQLVRWALDREVDLGQFIVPVAFLAVAWWPSWWVLAPVTAVVVVMNLVSGMRGVDQETGRERDTSGWMPIAVFYAVFGAGVVLGGSWIVAAALMALVVATYQWAASSRNQETFRWFGTAAVGAVGLLGLTGVLAGISLRLEDLLDVGNLGLRLPAVTEWMSLVAFFATAAAWGAGALYALATWTRWRTELFNQEKARAQLARPYLGDYEIRSAVRWRVLARSTRSIDVLITVYAMLLFSATIAGIGYLWWRQGTPFFSWLDQPVGGGLRPWLVVASWAELAYVFVAYWMVRSALRDEGWRRRLGMIWDVATFWPNRYHPFSPPAYAARAVPELIDRVQADRARIGTNPAPAAIILSGHSQGSVLCFAAVAALPKRDAKRVVLVTHGSPLGGFYRTFFPGVFTGETFEKVGKKLLGSQHCDDGSWVNFYRATDPIAGRLGLVSKERADVVSPWLRQWDAGLPDVLLQDPCRSTLGTRQRPVVRGHLDYDADPCMSRTLDDLTEILEVQARKEAVEAALDALEGDPVAWAYEHVA